MLLIDLSSIVITSTIELMTQSKDEPLTADLIRHIVLSQILFYKNKFKEYGKPILCADSTAYWRKDVFPYYKQNRKKVREKSVIDWNAFFKIFNEIKADLIENFPFALVEVAKLEADDIIAVMTGDEIGDVMIVSSDKDMLQLQSMHGNRVRQYSPSVKKLLTLKNKDYCLMTHIIKGDSTDGIPNILSDDDTFVVDEKRQKSVYAKFIDRVKAADTPFDVITDPVQRKKFKRNKLLIDAQQLPPLVIQWVRRAANKELSRPKKAHMYQYLMQHDMKIMLARITEFTS